MLKRIFFQIFFVFWVVNLNAQDPVNNKYIFKNGIYQVFDEFKSDKPFHDSTISNLNYDLNAEENILILTSESQIIIDSIFGNKIWGICVDGQPYIRVNDHQNGRPYMIKLHVVGKLSYFYYKAFREKEVVMYVHNPYTGEKIGKKSVTNRDLVFIQRLLHFYSGETIDFNYENLKLMSADDVGLLKSLEEMKPEERENKLFKSLLIYNDRNPVYIEKK